MTHATLSAKERLQQLEHEIAQCEPLANAEKAFSAASPDEENPWSGQAKKLATLRAEREDAVLLIAGETLNQLLAKRQELQQRLDRLHTQRQAADRQVAERAQHPTVVRYRNAVTVCIRMGWGHSWELFRQFLESGRSLRQGAPDCSTFFLHDERAKAAGVSFNLESDRAAVRLWLEAKDTADKLLAQSNTFAEELRLLLREHPELLVA